MKRNYLLLALFLVVAFAALDVKQVNSKVAAPPAGSVGDPFATATCIQSGCHVGTAQTPPANGLTLAIGTGNPTTPLTSSFQYTPGTAYNIGFGINSSEARFGFQLIPLKASDNTMAGDVTATNNTNTSVATLASTRKYIGHKSASSNKNWVFRWTAPAAGTGAVTFYYAYNTANGNNLADAADDIYKSSLTITEATGTGIADISTKVADLNIFPNPITNSFGLSFNLIEANQVAAQLYTLDGKLAKELINEKMSSGAFNQQFDITEFPAGIYLVKMNVGDASVSKKIIKL